MLGAGTQARSHLRALAGVRAFERVRVYAPTAAHAEDVVDEAGPAGLRASPWQPARRRRSATPTWS